MVNFTSDDNAFVKFLVLIFILGLSVHYSLDIVKVFIMVIFNGCYFILTYCFHSILQLIVFINLISIVFLFQKYQKSISKPQKIKFKQTLIALFATLWLLTIIELNRIINYQYPNNTLVRFIFQFICISTFIIGIIFYFKFSSTATFHKINKFHKQKCPICIDNIIDGIQMNECKHSICLNNECAYNYIHHSITDITKYPIKCFQHNCVAIIYEDVIKEIINYQKKVNNTMVNECQKLFAKYERFNLITNTPKHLRIDCPNADCNNILLKTEPPLNTQFSDKNYPISSSNNSKAKHSHYKPLKSVKQCESDLCLNKFSMLKWRYNCVICGNVFCFDCVRFKMQILELGYIEPIDLCMICFTNLFCIQCNDCNQMICYRCEQPWHNVCDKNDNQNGICKQVMVNDKVAIMDAKTKKMMKNNKFQKCPQCGIMIEKIRGCNHITHLGCLNKTEANGTHFCYTCGELLYGKYHNQERNGIIHFPKGVYKSCRKTNKVAITENCLVM
eukprot:131912_1